MSEVVEQETINAIVNTQPEQIVVSRNVGDNAAMSNVWSLSGAVIQEINNASKMYASKHGMFASVPIICKAQDCQYYNTCIVDKTNRRLGQRCPAEIGAIITRYEYWCGQFDIDTNNDLIDERKLVDASLVRDLVNIEIQMMRAENRLAMSGDFMARVLLDIDKKCKAYWGYDVSPESNFLLTLQDKKIKILNQLNATRKDKAAEKTKSGGPTGEAIRIFQEMQKVIKEKQIIDVDDIVFNENEYEAPTTETNHVAEVVYGVGDEAI